MIKGLTVVIVNTNGIDWLEKICASFSDQIVNVGVEIIVVDNESQDASVKYVKRHFPKIKVIEKANEGFGSAANFGASVAHYDHVLFVDQDSYPPDGFLQAIVDYYNSLENHSNLGSIGTQSVKYDGSTVHPAHCGVGVDLLMNGVMTPSPERVVFNSGSPLFVDRRIFNRVGGFCPNIFLYSEDVDYGLRCCLIGLETHFISTAHYRHFGSGVTGRSLEKKIGWYINGEVISVLNNFGWFTASVLLLVNLIFYCSVFLFMFATFRFGVCKNIFQAYVLLYRKRSQIIEFRKFVQGMRLRSDLDLIRKIHPTFVKVFGQ